MGMATILVNGQQPLAIFHFPAPGRFQMKFEQHWPEGSRGEVIWNSEHFSHTNA